MSVVIEPETDRILGLHVGVNLVLYYGEPGKAVPKIRFIIAMLNSTVWATKAHRQVVVSSPAREGDQFQTCHPCHSFPISWLYGRRYLASMDQVLAINQIGEQFDSEWVLLADPQVDDLGRAVRGKVVAPARIAMRFIERISN